MDQKLKETEALFGIVLDHKKVKSLAIRVSGLKFQNVIKQKCFVLNEVQQY